MKHTTIAALLAATLLSGCQWYEREQPVANPDQKPAFNVIRATTDEEDISDVTLLCIDGITYVVIPGLGMSVKYIQVGIVGDPVVQTCINDPASQKKGTKL